MNDDSETQSLDSLLAEVSKDFVVRTAGKENDLRRQMATAFHAARQAKGLSIRGLAEAVRTSVSQIQRLLHEHLGGSLTLRTLVRAADALDLDITINVRPRHDGVSTVIPMGSWCRLEAPGRSAQVVTDVRRGLPRRPPAWVDEELPDQFVVRDTAIS